MGVDKIILLSHMQQYGIGKMDELAPRLEHVDVIIAGGSNALFADSDDVVGRRNTKHCGRISSLARVAGEQFANCGGEHAR